MDEIENAKNYLRNTETSKGRTIRIELVGEVSEEERHFLDGCAYFMAGTLTKDDRGHIVYVSGLMSRLIKEIVRKMKGERGKQA
jgi:hypothetical protein